MTKNKSNNIQEISFDDNQVAQNLFGAEGCNLRLLESSLKVTIFNRGNEVKIQGSDEKVKTAAMVLEQVYQLIEEGFSLSKRDWQQAIYSVGKDPKLKLTQVYKDGIKLPTKKTNGLS
jgi:phosphate starvation-inducible PhoH-like protein